MRRLPTRLGVPDIALSGRGMENDPAKRRAAGFRHLLIKPAGIDRLKSFVAEIDAKGEASPVVIAAPV